MTFLRQTFLFLFVFIAMGIITTAAQAQSEEPLPKLPEPIQNLVNEGAQIRYLGRDYGVDAWITIKNGKEQYFYVLPDQKAFLMGVMFDNTGKLVTVDQVTRLRQQNGGDKMLDILTEDFTSEVQASNKDGEFEFKSPSEQLFHDVQNSNWIPLGNAGAPIMYAFIDPQCPHCHAMLEDLKKDYIDTGRVQIRIIPIGFREETRAQSAFLLAAPNPQERLFKYMAGDEEALPARSEINQQGVQRNLALMQSWKFNVTPMVVYRSVAGDVKLVRGRPQNIEALVNDLGSRQ
ncbi:MAG: thiol:disulfide interchange protein DsbG [Micavibrio sp.]|nr:thiol:disulfide interchange protein DsbG [Micavibrio sp.]|tara:strand:+ start:640 stop:1509 length:870 start_codon:yes stop_codon:yes gene_type:complete